MRVKKKVLAHLSKCYSIAPLQYKGRNSFLVAAEKKDRCLLFDENGRHVDTVWEEPGGVMTMAAVPGANGQFLATHRFYSPNDSQDAKLVIATPKIQGGWEIRTLVKLPFVHRFDILTRDRVRYLIACTLKSGHEYQDDWSMPGKVYAAVLPDDLTPYCEENQLKLTVIQDGLLKNHGYYRIREHGRDQAVISAENGVFRFVPPAAAGAGWEIEQLLDEPASDAVMLDLDGDGEKELAVISPFHGDTFCIYKRKDGIYEPVYRCPEKMEFLHAVYGGPLCGRQQVALGFRGGKRGLVAFSYRGDTGTYESETLDEGCGPANVYHYVLNGKDIIISANRESDEVAMYELEP